MKNIWHVEVVSFNSVRWYSLQLFWKTEQETVSEGWTVQIET
jgi:hypothetical protein